MNYSLELIKKTMQAKGYVWFDDEDNKSFDVNIIGVRNVSTGGEVTNLFDDTITLSYKEYGVWKFFQWSATTEPGKKGMLEGKAVGGVAFLVPGQYRKSHSIGLHQGKYQALRQVGPLKLYRDGDKDLEFDKDKIMECDNCGINIHMAGDNSTLVENWSEGCQVFRRKRDFLDFMAVMKQASLIHGNRFSYTLLESSDIFPEHKVVGEKKDEVRKTTKPATKPVVKPVVKKK
jgi:hypothetical protein